MDKSETEQDSQMHKNQMQKKNALSGNFENCIKNEKNSVNAGEVRIAWFLAGFEPAKKPPEK